jgi:hypothetical protein
MLVLGHDRTGWGSFILGSEQLYKWNKHHIFTQNLKALSSSVLLLIKCSTSTFLSNVKLKSLHTCHNILPLKCQSFAPPQVKGFFSSIHLHRRYHCTQWDTSSDYLYQENFLYKETVEPWSLNYRLWYHC